MNEERNESSSPLAVPLALEQPARRECGDMSLAADLSFAIARRLRLPSPRSWESRRILSAWLPPGAAVDPGSISARLASLHGQPWLLAQRNVSAQPPATAQSAVRSSQGQPCSRACCRHGRCPPEAAAAGASGEAAGCCTYVR